MKKSEGNETDKNMNGRRLCVERLGKRRREEDRDGKEREKERDREREMD